MVLMFKRQYGNLQKLLKKGKVIVIYGPRRVGKTTLLNNFIQNSKLKCKLVSGDNIETRNILSSQSAEIIGEYIEGYKLIAIDEHFILNITKQHCFKLPADERVFHFLR